jgi:hypothetical protein
MYHVAQQPAYPVAQPMVVPQPVAVVAAPVIYTMHLACHNLDRKDVFSKSDPFLVLSAAKNPAYKSNQYKTEQMRGGHSAMNSDWVMIHKTETIMNNQKPVFRPFAIDLMQLCRGNMDQQFLVECWDWDGDGRHDFIGSVQTTIREMQVMKEINLRNPHRFSAITKTAGVLQVLQCAPGGSVPVVTSATMVSATAPGMVTTGVTPAIATTHYPVVGGF